MKKQTYILLGVVFLVLTFSFLINSYFKKKAQARLLAGADQNTTGTTTPQDQKSETSFWDSFFGMFKSPFPLQRGSSGTYVSELQQWLNQTYGAGLQVDGQFGSKTLAAVQKYLQVDQISYDVYKTRIDVQLASADVKEHLLESYNQTYQPWIR